ncbi:hypothetical protein [Melioribacter sp. OK-6-Me]|uniref:hypothetical protein n=1 Tax=unclassified Melioribacter TaxID=2627329 RepID=UPI003ED96119
MKLNFRTITGILLLILGLLQIIDIYSGVDHYKHGFVLVLALYGISINYFSLRTSNRRIMLFSVFIFLTSILILSLKLYNISLSSEVIIFSSMFMISAFMLTLYIDNPEEKIFLFGFIIGMLVTIGSFYLLQIPYVQRQAGKVIGYSMKILPAVLIAGGLSLFLKRKQFD